MGNKLLWLVLAAAFVGICNAAPLNTNEEDARKFVQNADKKILSLMEDISEVTIVLEETPPTLLGNISDKIKNAGEVISEINRESLQFNTTQFKDEELKFIFKQIQYTAEESILGGSPFRKLRSAVRKLMKKNMKKKTGVKYFPTVQHIITQSNNTKLLYHYWSNFRTKMSRVVLLRLKNLTEELFDAAKTTNLTPVEFWMMGHNLTEMERLMNETQPLYVQLHAFIRHKLLKKYGDSAIKADGPIPDHLFRQVVDQAWTNGSLIDEMFPHKNLPPYNEILEKKNFGPLDLYKAADEFYRSLGLESDPKDLFESRIKIRTKPDRGDCRPFINDFTSIVSSRVCKKMDFRTFLQAHGYMAPIYFAMQKKNLPSYYLNSYSLEFPVGEAIILSASTLSHLRTIGLLPDIEITDEVQFNRLLRMAIHTLLNIPMHYVNTKTLADLFEGKVDIRALNKHYWSLMDRFAGVEPPNDRLFDTFDFSYEFYMGLTENRQAKKFYSEILGYQIYKRLCQISGKYDREHLYDCDFHGNKEVGNVLRSMMSLGSSKPLNKVLETIFPDNTTITADSLLEYYSPIKDWLEQKNQEENVNFGWKPSTKAISLNTDEDDYDYEEN